MTRPASLVSVIIPAFNAAKTVGEAIDSVLRQTAANIEVLAVDDGSTDETLEVLEEIRKRESSRVQVLMHPGCENRGVAASRNLALDHATGEFIAFLDADDAWLPEKLERQIRVLESHPHIGLVFSDTWVCRTDDTATPMADQTLELDPLRADLPVLFSGKPGSTAKTLFFQPIDYPFNWVPSPTPLVRRALFDRGLRFVGPPELNVQFEDWAMWLVLSLRCEFHVLSEPTTIYRVHASQYTSTFRSESRLKSINGLAEVYQAVMKECCEEIASLAWRPRVRQRYADFLCGKAARSSIAEMPLLLRLAGAWQCRGQVTRSFVRARRNRVHWAIRNSFLFRPCRPLLRFLKRIINRDPSQPAS